MSTSIYNNQIYEKKNPLSLIKNNVINIRPSISNKNDDYLLCKAINNTKGPETLDTSSRENKDVLIETDSDLNSAPRNNNSKKIITKIQKDEVKKNIYTELSIGRMEYQLPQKYNNRNNILTNKFRNNSHTFFYKKDFIDGNSFKWNNISFKEIKFKNNLDNKSCGKNVDDSFFKSHKRVKQLTAFNKNKNVSIEFNTPSLLNSIKNNIDKIEKNILNKKIYKNTKIRNILFNENKKSNKNNDIKSNNFKSNAELKNKDKFKIIKSKYLYKFKIIKDNDSKKKSSLYQYYKNYIKSSKIGRKLKLKDIQSIKLKNKKIQITKDKNYIKKINKIQAVWRGIAVRELMSYFWSIRQFKNILNSVMAKNAKKIIIELFKNYKNKKDSNSNKEINDKKIKIKFDKKVQKYNNLSRDFIYIGEKGNEIAKKINSNIIFENNNNCDNDINYNYYLNHFNANLNIINNEKINIEKDKTKQNIKSKNEFVISNSALSLVPLINNNKKFREICHNESINIMKNKKIELKEERQVNLYTEIKGDINKFKSFENCVINNQNNSINIIHIQKSKTNKYNDLLIKFNLIKDFNIEGKKKEYLDKETETSEELNKIWSKNRSEMTFKAIGPSLNNNLDYNLCNEIDNREGLEINPVEMKRTKNNINNRFISNENKIQFLNDKKSIMTEKAKINMMKIILPIRIRTTLKEWAKKNIFFILISKLKKITFVSYMIRINENYINKAKRYGIEKIKLYNFLYYKNYYLNQCAKNKILKIMKRYIIYKWNIILRDLSKNLDNKK